MSLRPDEIVVGHVYRGQYGPPRRIKREMPHKYAGPCVVYEDGSIEFTTPISEIARWAQADITQEEQANG